MGNEANKRKEQIKEDMLQSEIKAHSIKGHKKKNGYDRTRCL